MCPRIGHHFLGGDTKRIQAADSLVELGLVTRGFSKSVDSPDEKLFRETHGPGRMVFVVLEVRERCNSEQ